MTDEAWTFEEVEALQRTPHDERLAQRLAQKPVEKQTEDEQEDAA